MASLKTTISKWISSRRQLYYYEGLFYTSSAIFNFVALSCSIYLLYQFQQRKFADLSALEMGALVFLVGTLAVNGVHYFLTSFFRSRRRKLESDLHFEGLHPVYDQDTFFDVLKKEMRRAGRYHLPMSLCYVSLDEFEEIGRKHGRRYAGKTIQKFADLIVEIIRSSDYLAHLGGNSFCVLLCHTDLVHAENFLYRLLLQSQERLEMSFSSGLTAFRPGENTGDFMKRAQAAMDFARTEGGKKTRCAIGKDDQQIIKSFDYS